MPQINSEYFGRVLRDAFRLNNQPEGLETDNYILPVYDLSPPQITCERDANGTVDNTPVTVGTVVVPRTFNVRIRSNGAAAAAHLHMFDNIGANQPFCLVFNITGDCGAAGLTEFSIEARWPTGLTTSKHMFYEYYHGTAATRNIEVSKEYPYIKFPIPVDVMIYQTNTLATHDVMVTASLLVLPS